jgi:hypothetical protein
MSLIARQRLSAEVKALLQAMNSFLPVGNFDIRT